MPAKSIPVSSAPTMRWLRQSLDLVLTLTAKEVKVRYKSSVLGYLWSVAMPLCLAAVFYLAFKVVMRVPMEHYALFLVCGLFPWQWFANSVQAAATILLGNASIIKKVAFPRAAVCLAMVMNDGLHFLLSVPVIAGLLLIAGKHPSLSWLFWLPLLFVLHAALVTGISLVVAAVNLFFRDMERLVVLGVTLLFYFTPVIYSETMVPAPYDSLLAFNPMAPLIICWRSLFLGGGVPLEHLGSAALWAMGILFGGMAVFRRLSPRFAEVL